MQFHNQGLLPLVLRHQLVEDVPHQRPVVLQVELFVRGTGLDRDLSPCPPLLDASLGPIRSHRFVQLRSGHSLVLQPLGDVFPCVPVFMLFLFVHKASGPVKVELLNLLHPSSVGLVALVLLLMCHFDHFHSLNVLSLTPL